MSLPDKLRRLFDIVARDTSHPGDRSAAAHAGLRLLDARAEELSSPPQRPAIIPFSTAMRHIALLEAENLTLRVKLRECSPGERDPLIRADRDDGMTYDELAMKWKLRRTQLSKICNARGSRRRR